MDFATTQRLLTPTGRSLLDALPPYDEGASLRLGEELRAAGYDAGLVAAALTQSRLRTRARRKLGEFADGMVFTPDGLEQATRLQLAARHAHRFHSAGVRHVFDLGCGIGADAMTIAGLGMKVTAVETDPVTAALAEYNLRHFPDVNVLRADARSVPLTSGDGDLAEVGAWLDPARRIRGRADAMGRTRRTSSLADLCPSWEFVNDVAAQIPATGAKLSPGLPHGAVPAGTEATWTSYDGEVLECVVWWGPLVRTLGRCAVVVHRDPGTPDVVVTEADADGVGPVAAQLPVAGDYLYEPDRAVLRAGLIGALTAATDGAELAHGVGYVTAKKPVVVPFARRYVVTAAMPLQVKSVRAWLRGQDVGRLTIKKRGVDLDPDLLRRQLKLDGRGDQLTVVLTRVGSRQAFLVVEPS